MNSAINLIDETTRTEDSDSITDAKSSSVGEVLYLWSNSGILSGSERAPLDSNTMPDDQSALALAVEEKASAALDELAKYYTFLPEWDGYSGKTFTSRSVQIASSIICLMATFFK